MNDDFSASDAGSEDDDWIDLEPAGASLAPLATLTLSRRSGRNSAKPSPARAIVWLRRELAQWAKDNGPRFRLQIGGAAAHRVRIIPDALRGKFEAGEFKGTVRLNLGIVNIWPNEERPPVAAEASIEPGGLVLTLPGDFARPARLALPAPAPTATPKAAAPTPTPMPAPKAAPRPLPPPSAGPSGREIVADNLALKAALGVTNDFPREIGGAHYTPQEAAILEALLKRAQMSRAGLLIASHDPMSGEDERDEKIVDVFICRIRKKLEPIGVKILTSGGAFSIDLGDKAKLRAAIAAARGGAV